MGSGNGVPTWHSGACGLCIHVPRGKLAPKVTRHHPVARCGLGRMGTAPVNRPGILHGNSHSSEAWAPEVGFSSSLSSGTSHRTTW